MPATGVYFVKPRAIAALAAASTLSGVGKSGSPEETGTMSRPSAFSRRARSVAKLVGDGLMRDSAAERNAKVNPLLQLDVLRLDELAPLAALLRKILRKLFRRTGDQDQAGLEQRSCHVRQLHSALQGGAEPGNDRRRRSRRHETGNIGGRLETGHGLGD